MRLAGVLRDRDDLLVWLQIRAGQGDQKMRVVVAKGIKERRGSGAYQRGRNWPEGLADAAEFGEKYRRLETVFMREKKRGRGRSAGAFYKRGQLGEGARVSGRLIGWLGGVVRGRDGGQRRKKGPARWGRRVRGRRWWLRTLSGKARVGHGPNPMLGWFGSSGPFLIFYFLFLFFLQISELFQFLLHTSLKSIQTSF
jgi:hypothetical protein